MKQLTMHANIDQSKNAVGEPNMKGQTSSRIQENVEKTSLRERTNGGRTLTIESQAKLEIVPSRTLPFLPTRVPS
jgi:hypothetical protein